MQEAGRGICIGEIHAIGAHVAIDKVIEPVCCPSDEQAKKSAANYVPWEVNA